jgi:hypothetical protein
MSPNFTAYELDILPKRSPKRLAASRAPSWAAREHSSGGSSPVPQQDRQEETREFGMQSSGAS